MNRRGFVLFLVLWCVLSSMAQNIPVPLTQTKLYDYLDELVTDGVISVQTAVRPYSREQVAKMLVEAQSIDSLLELTRFFSASVPWHLVISSTWDTFP